jgi:hypothetical protein
MSSFSIYLLTFALLLQTIYGASPLFHFCSSSENFTTNDPYASNLRKLLGNLYYQTPPQGFGVGSVGQDPYKANGLWYGQTFCLIVCLFYWLFCFYLYIFVFVGI